MPRTLAQVTTSSSAYDLHGARSYARDLWLRATSDAQRKYANEMIELTQTRAELATALEAVVNCYDADRPGWECAVKVHTAHFNVILARVRRAYKLATGRKFNNAWLVSIGSN